MWQVWHRAAPGTPCPGLGAAGSQADLHLLAASWQGLGVSAGASAPGSGTPACASWVEPCVIVRLMFSKAGFHLASGGGTGCPSTHGLLACDPVTGGIWVELLPVGKQAQTMSGKKAVSPTCAAVCSEERGEVVPSRRLTWWRCRHRWWGWSFQVMAVTGQR